MPERALPNAQGKVLVQHSKSLSPQHVDRQRTKSHPISRPQSAKTIEKEMKELDLNAQPNDFKLEYCLKHLEQQIEILQRCLSQEENLSNEDQIFVALAELKKVRDVLKGSLRIVNDPFSNANGMPKV